MASAATATATAAAAFSQISSSPIEFCFFFFAIFFWFLFFGLPQVEEIKAQAEFCFGAKYSPNVKLFGIDNCSEKAEKEKKYICYIKYT